MKLLLDNIVYSLQRAGGISTYWYELSRRFLQVPGLGVTFIESERALHNIQRKRLDVSASAIIAESMGVRQRFKRISGKWAGDQTIFHSSYFRVLQKGTSATQVCTVHDFTHDFYYSGPRIWLHNFAKRRAVLESDVTICISENTRMDALRFFPSIDPSRFVTIYNGVSSDFHVLPGAEKTGEPPYLLYVGSREHYKNFGYAVSLAAAARGFHLYIVGGPLTPSEASLLEVKLRGRYKVLAGIDNQALNRLYNAAYCLLYPSSYEGFGLPLVESMKAGCPFIALRGSAIPEVAGDAGVLLSGLDVDEGLAAISVIGNDRAGMVGRGMIQANKFSWDLCFEQTYTLYKDLLSR